MASRGRPIWELFLAIIVKVALLYLLERHYYTWLSRLLHLIEATVRIGKDDVDRSSDGSFVIVSGSNILYDPLWLRQFGFALSAAAVYPRLEFCQWYCSNFNYSTYQCDSGYSRIWSPYYALHPEYDFFHQNPPIFNVPDVSYVYSQAFNIGAYRIAPDLAGESTRTRLRVLPEEAATNFTSSPLASQGWRSVGGGWLYRSYSGLLTPSYSDSTGFWKTVKNLFQAALCEPGSMRIELETFDATVVTALGLRTGNTIAPAPFEGKQMGLIAAGKKTSTEMLRPAFLRITFWTWVGRIVAIVIVVVLASIYVPDGSLRAILIVGEILLGITVSSSQWSSRAVTATLGFAAIGSITSALVGHLQSPRKSGENGC